MGGRMDEQVGQDQSTQRSLFGPGAQLRQAREAAGLTLQQVAAETRIAERHLAMIEAEEFARLPARTYAVGFSRSFAKAVGLDPNTIALEVRAALDAAEPDSNRRISAFEPGDPARVPSSRLAWLSALAAVLLLAGGYSFYRNFFVPGGQLPPVDEAVTAKPAQPARPVAASVPAGGAVTFTSLEDGIWVKFYDASGKQLMQKQMAKGEQYTVPADADGPQLWTGRPDALAISIGGKAMPPLADSEKVMKDVLVTPQALTARTQAAAAPPKKPAMDTSPTG